MVKYVDHNLSGDAEGWLIEVSDGILKNVCIGPLGYKFISGMYQSVAILAKMEIDVIVDDVIYDPLVLRNAINSLYMFNVWFIGIRCSLATAEIREVERGDREHGLAKFFFDKVHSHGIYDFEVTTDDKCPLTCATEIQQFIENGHSKPFAFNKLKINFA